MKRKGSSRSPTEHVSKVWNVAAEALQRGGGGSSGDAIVRVDPSSHRVCLDVCHRQANERVAPDLPPAGDLRAAPPLSNHSSELHGLQAQQQALQAKLREHLELRSASSSKAARASTQCRSGLSSRVHDLTAPRGVSRSDQGGVLRRS